MMNNNDIMTLYCTRVAKTNVIMSLFCEEGVKLPKICVKSEHFRDIMLYERV